MPPQQNPVPSSFIPQQTTPPPFQPPQFSQAPQPTSSRWGIKIVVVLFILIIAGALAAVVYGYARLGWFGTQKTSYTENNLLSGLLQKTTEINSSSYKGTVSLAVVPREKGSKPFTIQNSNEEEIRKQYENDSQRAKDVNAILSVLKYPRSGKKYPPYPASLSAALAGTKTPTVDPLGRVYTYQQTNNGNDFALTVAFETKTAAKAMSRTSFATSTIVAGTKVTFTKDSYSYVYFSPEPPKPFFEQMGEALKMLPPDVSGHISVGATADWGDEKRAAWKLNLEAAGDFGDLSYKVDIDALKKDTNYYFRINNMPSIIAGAMLASLKGQWIKVSAATSTASTSSPYVYQDSLSRLKSGLPEFEASYKKNREKLGKFLVAAAKIGDEEKLFVFSRAPYAEVVDGRDLIRYDLKIRKEALIPFLKRTGEEADKIEPRTAKKVLEDQGMMDYLGTKEFDEVFEYYNAHVTHTLWVDESGFPAKVGYAWHIVPPDTAAALKDKQIDVVFSLSISDINKGVNIDIPRDSKSLEALIEESKAHDYNGTQTAMLKSELSNIRAQAELEYDNTKNSYGAKAFPVGACTKKTGTLFGAEKIYSGIDRATGGKPATATCASSVAGKVVAAYAVSAPMPSLAGYSWCIDSTGSSMQIKGKITKASCR